MTPEVFNAASCSSVKGDGMSLTITVESSSSPIGPSQSIPKCSI